MNLMEPQKHVWVIFSLKNQPKDFGLFLGPLIYALRQQIMDKFVVFATQVTPNRIETVIQFYTKVF